MSADFPFHPMDEAKVISVIRTTLTRRGDGDETPIRVITQYWSLEGELLAEVDPLPDEELEALTQWGADTPLPPEADK